MAQYKKNAVKEMIDRAALEVFSKKGFQETKVRDISESSGVSVGNIYKYYKGKDDIFYGIISEDFFDSFKRQLASKIALWRRNNEGQNFLSSKEFIGFIIENYEKFLILLSGCQGTKYENFKTEIVSFLSDIFRSNYGSKLKIDLEQEKNLKFIELIYEKHIEMISSILMNIRDKDELKEMLEAANRYHVYGITGFIT